MKHLFLVIALLLLCLPLVAQDPTAEATPDAASVIVNVEAPETPAANDGSLWGLVLVVAGGFVSVVVAVSFGLQAVGNRAAAAANNPLEIAVIEKAYASTPESVVRMIVTPLQQSLERSDKALQDVLLLLGKVSDGVPESEKTTPAPTADNANTFVSTSTHDLASPATQAPSEG